MAEKNEGIKVYTADKIRLGIDNYFDDFVGKKLDEVKTKHSYHTSPTEPFLKQSDVMDMLNEIEKKINKKLFHSRINTDEIIEILNVIIEAQDQLKEKK